MNKKATRTPASIQVLLQGLIDYAGLFPPEELPLDQAIRFYSGYRTSQDAWILGTFLIPARRLSDLAAHASLFQTSPPFLFTVTARTGDSLGEYLAGLDKDMMEVRRFQTAHEDLVKITGYESRFPDDVLDGRSASRSIYELIESITDKVRQSLGSEARIFLEPSWAENWRFRLNTLSSAIGHFNREHNFSPPIGLKLRCGGVQPDDVPGVEIVASAIAGALRENIPMKFTAGLHHPFRHFRKEFGSEMHGFINVFLAGALTAQHGLSELEVRRIIEDKTPESFYLTENSAGWRDLSVTLEELKTVRNRLMTGFGSCSFTEPLNDLRTHLLLS